MFFIRTGSCSVRPLDVAVAVTVTETTTSRQKQQHLVAKFRRYIYFSSAPKAYCKCNAFYLPLLRHLYCMHYAFIPELNNVIFALLHI